MQITAEQTPVSKTTDQNYEATKTAIGKAALGLSVIAVFSKVFGFAEKLIVAHFFGTDTRADVYFASMGIVLSLVFLFKELIYPSVLPVFALTLKKSFYASSDLFRKLFFRLLIVLIIFAIIAVLFSGAITNILVPGFSSDKKVLTSSLLKFLTPACLFMCFMTFAQSILNCQKKFFKASVPEAGLKFFIAAGLIVLVPILGIYALAVAALVGSFLAFFVQFIFIPESKYLLAYRVYNANEEFSRILKLASPLVLGVIFSHISGLIDNMLASTLPTGQLSYLGYSKKLLDAILLIGPVALVTVVYSQLSHLHAEKKYDQFRALFVRSLRLILFVSIPVSVILIMLREPVIKVMFERGNFTAESTLGTSQALLIYAAGFVTFSVESLVVFGFYALSNTKQPVRLGIFSVVLDIILAISLIVPLGFAAIAWAFVISKTVKVILLIWVMNRKFMFLEEKFLNFIIRIAASCLFSAFCLNLLKYLNHSSSSLQRFIFDLLIPAAAFTSVFIFCCHIFKIKELKMILDVILRRKTFKSELVEDLL